MSDYRCLSLTRDGDILVVTIDRPGSRLNTVDDSLHEDLAQLFASLRKEREARAVVLTAAGPAFSGGGDFDWFPTLKTVHRLDELRGTAKRIIWDLVDIEVPIVAALNGHAIGLGASVALLCDLIVMSEDAKLGDPHTKVGIAAGDGGVAIWPLVLGPARAKEFLMLGESISAIDAQRLGLVNRVVPANQVFDEAMVLARRLADMPPLAVKYTKMAVNKLVKDALNTAFDYSTALEMLSFLSDDHDRALHGLKEGSSVDFTGH